jgi:hypothetical protein
MKTKSTARRTRRSTQRRAIVRKVRLHTHEDVQLRALAAACGLPVATYLRTQALGTAPPARRSAGADHTVRVLARIGTLLAALETHLQDSQEAPHDLCLAHAREARELATELIRGL